MPWIIRAYEMRMTVKCVLAEKGVVAENGALSEQVSGGEKSVLD